jgi:hypothetical protein
MKIIIVFLIVFFSSFVLRANNQMVRDPLLHFYGFGQNKDGDKFYEFSADLTGDGRQSIFITDDQSRLGPHGDYGWAVYVPVGPNYSVIEGGITAKLSGPGYIGYIDQIQRYGIINGGKYSVGASYLENGSIKSQVIDEEREHANAEHYPKYFSDKASDYHITTYTLDQLRQKYANPDLNNIIKLSTEKLPAQNAMNPSVVADSPPSTSKTPASSGPSSQHAPAVSSTSGSNTTDWLLIVAGVVAVLGVGFVLYRLLTRSGK